MSLERMIEALALPTATRVDQRVPKKLLWEQGARTTTDKRHIQDDIETLHWIAAIKPTNSGIPEFRDELREYLEIAVLTVVLRVEAKTTRLLELIHRAVPYPVLLLVEQPCPTNVPVAWASAHVTHPRTQASRGLKPTLHHVVWASAHVTHSQTHDTWAQAHAPKMNRGCFMWNLPPPPGFQGLREDLPLKMYDQLLPHWRQAGATYFVTFRLADSLPQTKLNELRAFKAEWERSHPPPRSHAILDEIAREMFRRIEGWLDQGMGSCVLKQAELAKRVIDAMHDRDGTDHELGCYVVMANHVHAIVRPLVPSDNDLEDILKIWKGRSAYEINRDRGESGTLWQRESYDRIIRDPEHLWRVIQSIGRNPGNAGLDPTTTPLWIRPSWIECGWRFTENAP